MNNAGLKTDIYSSRLEAGVCGLRGGHGRLVGSVNTALPSRGFRSGGFTLVELVLALGILGIALSSLLMLRLKAMEKVTTVAEKRDLRRIAQEQLEEKLALSLSGELARLTGPVEGKPGWAWEWQEEVLQEGEQFLLSYTMRITYPNPEEKDGEPRTYELTDWVVPTEDQLDYIIEQQQFYEEEGAGWGNYDLEGMR